MSTLPNDEERLHPSNGDPAWVEVWDNWFVLPDEGKGGYVTLTIRPTDGVCWYWAALIGFGRPLVTVLVDDLPLPRDGSMELRGSGIWTETSVMDPFVHLTTDLEAFGVAVDPPTDVWSGAWGDRVAVGLELDWDTRGEPGPPPMLGVDGYRLVGKTHGEVLLDDERWQIEGIGVRDHWWGTPDSTLSWRGWASRDGQIVRSDGGSQDLDVDLEAIVDRLPTGSVQPGLDVEAWAPARGGGRRFARALVSDERGSGWLEIVR